VFSTSPMSLLLDYLVASPLKWLLNGSSRATAPGPGVPLDEPDRDHDERMRRPRFSRVPQRRHRRPLVGPDIMVTLRGPRTVAPKRRPGTTGDIGKALTAIDKGFVRHGARCTAKLASFCEGEASFGITRLYHNVQPSDQGRQGYRLSCDGIGFVRASGA
jgi:hypothetical protein